MTLAEALDEAQKLDDGVVLARRPWNMNSDAVIAQYEGNFELPKALTDQGFEYFLEVAVAQEVLEVFGSRPSTVQQRRDLVLFYAENDAYPDWVYDESDE
jgi:hypothetical protein